MLHLDDLHLVVTIFLSITVDVDIRSVPGACFLDRVGTIRFAKAAASRAPPDVADDVVVTGGRHFRALVSHVLRRAPV